MPIDIVFDRDRNLIVRTVRGEVTGDELLQSIEAVLAHPDYRPGMKSLSDLRAMTPFADTDLVKRIAKLILRQADELAGGLAAVVVSRVVSYGMMRMLQTYAEESHLDIAVLYDLDEAEQWLGLTADREQGAPDS